MNYLREGKSAVLVFCQVYKGGMLPFRIRRIINCGTQDTKYNAAYLLEEHVASYTLYVGVKKNDGLCYICEVF